MGRGDSNTLRAVTQMRGPDVKSMQKESPQESSNNSCAHLPKRFALMAHTPLILSGYHLAHRGEAGREPATLFPTSALPGTDMTQETSNSFNLLTV